MQFSRRSSEEPEVNLIPFIDVLLVILIFLMLSTTYSRFTELQIQLPTADAQARQESARELLLGIGAEGQFSVAGQALLQPSVAALTQALRAAAPAGGAEPATLIIHADAAARHQAVVLAMEAARRAGLSRITFATQSSNAEP